MNNDNCDAYNSANRQHRRWLDSTWASSGQLLLVGWILATAGCAYTPKLKSLAGAAFDARTATIGKTGPFATHARNHRSEAPLERGQPTASNSSGDSSQQGRVELVGYQDERLEQLPVPLDHPPQGLVVDAESSMRSGSLPPPATLPPMGSGTKKVPQQYPQISPPIPPSTVGPQVVNLRGASFRESPKTATEIMLELRSENDLLRQQLAAEKRSYAKLEKSWRDQVRIGQQLADKVDRGQAEADRLRGTTAKLQVAVKGLVADKVQIKKESETALQKIESSLDAVLLDSISRARQRPNSANQ